jgi:hypothetical protein
VIEERRRRAQALRAPTQLLLEALAKQRREIERLRGKPADLQLTLKMLEMLQAKAAGRRRGASPRGGRAAEARRRAPSCGAPSPSVLEALKAWLWDQAALTSLSIGKAAAYTVANWDRLTRFVEDGVRRLDENDTQRVLPLLDDLRTSAYSKRSHGEVSALLAVSEVHAARGMS